MSRLTYAEQMSTHPHLAPILVYLLHQFPSCREACECGLDATLDALEDHLEDEIETGRAWAVRLEQAYSLVTSGAQIEA